MIIREGHLTRYIQASLLSSSRITALNSTGISMLGLGSTRELLTLTLWDLLGLLLAVDTVRALQGLVRETKYRVIRPYGQILCIDTRSLKAQSRKNCLIWMCADDLVILSLGFGFLAFLKSSKSDSFNSCFEIQKILNLKHLAHSHLQQRRLQWRYHAGRRHHSGRLLCEKQSKVKVVVRQRSRLEAVI